MWIVPAQCKLTEPCLCGGLDNDSVACHECWSNLADSQVHGICGECTIIVESYEIAYFTPVSLIVHTG